MSELIKILFKELFQTFFQINIYWNNPRKIAILVPIICTNLGFAGISSIIVERIYLLADSLKFAVYNFMIL